MLKRTFIKALGAAACFPIAAVKAIARLAGKKRSLTEIVEANGGKFVFFSTPRGACHIPWRNYTPDYSNVSAECLQRAVRRINDQYLKHVEMAQTSKETHA